MDDHANSPRGGAPGTGSPPPASDWSELSPLERLRFKRAVLDWCLRQAERALRIGRFEDALRWDLLAARTASFDCDPLVSPALEAHLLALAIRLPVPAPPSPPPASRPERWLHVFSEGHAYGGHTAMMRRWARMDRANQHSVLLLEQQGPAPESLVRVVGESGGRVLQIDQQAPLLEQAATLRAQARMHADFVVLHVHPWDVVATVALGVPGGPPVLFVNHGAHKFWVGASVADVVVNCRVSPQEDEWNRNHRSVDRNVILPIPIDASSVPDEDGLCPAAGARLRAALGISPSDLVLLTVGQGYKYTPLPGLDFLEAIVPILQTYRHTHLVAVGPTDDGRWRAARRATAGRVHAVGIRTDLLPYHASADLYLEGFPFGSMTAILEAGIQGIACVQPPRTNPPPFASDGAALAGLRQPTDLADWAARVRTLLTDRAARIRCGRALAASIAAHHSGQGWGAYLTALRTRLPREHRTYSILDPKPVPAHFAVLWAAFISRVNQHDPLAVAFQSAVHQGLSPVLDVTLRREARRATLAFHRNAPPTAFMTLAPPLLSAFPRSLRARLVDHLFVLLRPDGRLRRAADALLGAASPRAPMTAPADGGSPTAPARLLSWGEHAVCAGVRATRQAGEALQASGPLPLTRPGTRRGGGDRLLFVTRCLALGGTERHLADLVHRLDPATEATILCYGLDPYTHLLGDRQGRSVRIHSGLGDGRFLAYWYRFARARARTIVFINGDLGLFPWFAYLAARLSGPTRVVAIEHLIANAPPPSIAGSGILACARRLVGWRARRMLALRIQGLLSHWTICVSQAVAHRLTSQYGFPRRRTVTIWNGIDLARYRPASGGDPGARATVRRDLGIDPLAPVLLCIARLAPQKCVDVVLQAVATVSSTARRLHCLVVGDGPLRRDLTRLRDALGLGAIVHFVGPQDDVRPFLEASDLYVTASRREGFGLSLAEAMAYALPCIATDIGGHNEIVEHGRSGLLVRPESPDELARAISYLLAHEGERARLGRLGQERVRACFDLEDAMRQITGILRDGTLRPRRGAMPHRGRPAADSGPVGGPSCES